ncbi:TIGR04222 domain-containing membrane protein [Nonomuraea sp. NPDC004580]|uniref:TIGR04222 domain-containing membrane protein n=1 Tax=Nonomuraea sp. NPDC004580 TaxID=3154552 RepID=UPI0033A13224
MSGRWPVPRLRRPGGGVRDGVRDAYELAVLTGGPRALAGTAIIALLRRSAVRASRSGRYTVIAGAGGGTWHPAEQLVLDLLAARLGRAHRRDLERAPEWAALEKRIRLGLVRRGLLRRGTLGPTQAGDAACRAALAAHPARDGTLESYVLHGPPTLVPALVMTAPEDDDDDPGGGTGDGDSCGCGCGDA